MEKSLGIVMDPIQSINYLKDTSLSILLAAQQQGFRLFYMEQQDLFLENGVPYAEYSHYVYLTTPIVGMSWAREVRCHWLN